MSHLADKRHRPSRLLGVCRQDVRRHLSHANRRLEYGRLPKELKISDLKKTHPSLPANPHMAHVFYLRGIIERVGRGTLKIVEQCKAAGLRVPQWKEAASGITLTFFSQQQRQRLNRRQRDLLERLKPGEELKPSDYYADIESVVSQRQARRDLAGLESAGWLRQEGEGPSTVYIRTERKAPSPVPDPHDIGNP